MAKFFGLNYHKDSVEKHEITEEEIKFLMDLQKEMNTQSHVGQADPRYWVIKGSEREYGIETGYEDDSEVILDGTTVAYDLVSFAKYIEENVLEDINSDGVERKMSLVSGIFHPSVKISWNDDEYEDYEEFDNLEDMCEWLNDKGYEFTVSNYRIIPKIYENTMFLTNKEAQEHLKANYYHYSDDAHTYAMTSWRNPETEKLWEILQKVDWEKIGWEKE